MPSDKKISDLRSGVTLQAGDKILVTRGSQNVYVTGSETPVLANFVPPTAKLFPHGAWGNGATGPLNVSDHPRGLIMADNSGGTAGFKFASRTIPESMQSQFVFTARISYNGLTKQNSGAGIGFTTATTGPGGRAFYLTRNFGYNGKNMGAHGGYWNPQGNTPFNDINGSNYGKGWEFNWFRGIVLGNVAQLYYSEDGVNFTIYNTIDFGSPVTSYGLVMEAGAQGSNAALCDYFDSTELQLSPNLRQTGTVTAPTLLTGVHAPHQYWRLNISENWGGPNVGLTGLQLRGNAGGTNLIPESYGSRVLSSDGSTNADQAYNNGLFNIYDGWYAAGPSGYIGFNFPYPLNVEEFTYRANQNGRDGASSPKNLTIEYSDDGVTWYVARTINNLPIGGNALTTLVVDPDKAAVSGVNAKAKSAVVLKTGVKAAYSTRRLYDDYNGPLFAIEGAGGSYDVFAGTNGEADNTLITRVGSGGDVSVTKWYDQSGNNHHAIPMPQGLPSRFTGYRPLVASAGQPVHSGPSLGIKFAGSPMDILDLNFLSSASYVIVGAQVNRYGGTNVAQIVSGLTTLNDSVAVAVITDGRISAVRNRDTRSDSAAYLAPRTFGYVVSKLAMSGKTVSSAVALNGFALTNLPALTYADGDSNTGTRTRIGAPASAAYADAGYDTVDGTIREIFIYDTTVVLEDLYNSIIGLTKAKPIVPVIYETPTIEDPTNIGQKPTETIVETTPTQPGPVTAGEKKFVPAKKGYVGAGTATPKYNTFCFTIPDYNTITFEAVGGGGSSGESAWDGPLPNTDDPGLDGPNGGSTIFAAPGASYVLQPNLAIGHSGGAYHMVDPTVDFTVIGRGGFGGKGWYFNGGGYSKAGSNPGPASANGADGIGEFQHITPGTAVTGGGAAGGARTPYLGVYTSEMGGAGGKGGLATKTWNRSDVGAPKPGEVWTIVVGTGGVYGNAYGGAGPGKDGSASIRGS